MHRQIQLRRLGNRLDVYNIPATEVVKVEVAFEFQVYVKVTTRNCGSFAYGRWYSILDADWATDLVEMEYQELIDELF